MRVADLQAERTKPLEADAEFYKASRCLPSYARKLEANEAAQQAQRDVILAQKAEIVRINALYDAELARLKRLWAGAPPGSCLIQPVPPRRQPRRRGVVETRA